MVQTIIDVETTKEKVRGAANKAVGWRDRAVNFATNHPKTTLLLLGVSAVANLYLAVKGMI